MLDVRNHGIRILVKFQDVEGFPVWPHAPFVQQGARFLRHRRDNLGCELLKTVGLSREHLAHVVEGDISRFQAMLWCLPVNRHGQYAECEKR